MPLRLSGVSEYCLFFPSNGEPIAILFLCQVIPFQSERGYELLPRWQARLLLCLTVGLVYGLASVSYKIFPARLRLICCGLLAMGFIALIAAMLFSNFASDAQKIAYGLLMAAVIIAGALSSLIGYILLQRLNRE